MDQSQWNIISDILDEALSISDPDKRKAYIKSACGDNKRLYIQVNKLLTSIRKANQTGFLE